MKRAKEIIDGILAGEIPFRMAAHSELSQEVEQMSRQHKYRVSKKEDRTVDGIVFDSKKEAKRYAELKILALAGEISDLQLQPEFRLWVSPIDRKGNLQDCGAYRADFLYMGRSGEIVVEDVKGMKTPLYKLKRKLVEAIYGITILET